MRRRVMDWWSVEQGFLGLLAAGNLLIAVARFASGKDDVIQRLLIAGLFAWVAILRYELRKEGQR